MTIPIQDWLVWAAPLIAVPIVPLLGKISSRARNYFAVAVIVLTSALSIDLLATPLPRESSVSWLTAYGLSVQIRVDGLSTFLAIIVNLLGLAIITYSLGYMKGEEGQSRYYALILLFIGSMTGLVIAGNFLQLYIFWEMVGICSSFLISFWYHRPAAVRAGLKAFIVTRVGDVGLLAGLAYLYVNTGTFSFSALEDMATRGAIPISVLTFSGLLVFLGAMGKSAQFPLHVWLPDAMEGPSTVSALIHAATMVNAGVYLVARTLPIFSSSATWLLTVEVVGIVSALAAAPLAIAAFDIKRVLAYSTISQLGLMFASLGLGNGPGLFASQYHLLSQGAFKALGFLGAGSVIHSLGIQDMNSLGGLRKKMPLTFIAFAASVLAMAGIPPFIGFWSKDSILSASSQAGNLGLFVLILLVGAMTSFYAFRALFKVFIAKPFADKSEALEKAHESPLVMTVPLMALSVAVLSLFLFQGSISQLLGSSPAPLELWTIVLSLSVAVVGLVVAYVLYIRRAGPLISSGWVSHVQAFLIAGYGFDKLYDVLIVHPSLRIASGIRRLQTGILGMNMWGVLIFLAIVLAVFLLWSS